MQTADQNAAAEGNQAQGAVPQANAGVGAVGTVNFEANLVPNAVQAAAATAEAHAPASEPTTLGNQRPLGTAEVKVVSEAQVPRVEAHTIGLSIDLTLNTGFTLLKGMKELKTVDIERDGTTEKFNFYNPFLKSDKDRQTGEGLMRKTFASIARIAHGILGREAVYLGSDATMRDTVAQLIHSVRTKLQNQFPLNPTDVVFEIEVESADGDSIPRSVQFGELFAINAWLEVARDEDACLTIHNAHFNIVLNAAALYDSAEPHVFVGKAKSFLETQLVSVGLVDVVDYHVNYAIDSTTLESAEVRETLDMLFEEGYTLVSKTAVIDGRYSWVKPADADSLFGYGCDLILRSPSPEMEDDGEAEAE